jgi:hypothetical protein
LKLDTSRALARANDLIPFLPGRFYERVSNKGKKALLRQTRVNLIFVDQITGGVLAQNNPVGQNDDRSSPSLTDSEDLVHERFGLHAVFRDIEHFEAFTLDHVE